jgi:hypothetical protein
MAVFLHPADTSDSRDTASIRSPLSHHAVKPHLKSGTQTDICSLVSHHFADTTDLCSTDSKRSAEFHHVAKTSDIREIGTRRSTIFDWAVIPSDNHDTDSIRSTVFHHAVIASVVQDTERVRSVVQFSSKDDTDT